MTTYYNGYDIEWLEKTFKVKGRRFKSLRAAMDYIDSKRKETCTTK